MPKGLPPTLDHEYAIYVQPGSVPPSIRPYMYPYASKSEIDSMVQEIFEASIIQPSKSAFSSLVVC